MALSIKELRRRGVPDSDIETAKKLQRKQRELGVPVKTLGEICGFGKTASKSPVDLTERQLKKRGRIGQAALLLDQEALSETDFLRRAQLRKLSNDAKEISEQVVPTEFDFFKGNRMIADEFHDAVRDRLNSDPSLSISRRATAFMVLGEICRHLPWEGPTCLKTAAELADLLKLNYGVMAETLALLEKIGAIHRTKRGRTKVITVTPEGAYRGSVHHHAEAVAKFKAEVIDFKAEVEKRT